MTNRIGNRGLLEMGGPALKTWPERLSSVSFCESRRQRMWAS